MWKFPLVGEFPPEPPVGHEGGDYATGYRYRRGCDREQVPLAAASGPRPGRWGRSRPVRYRMWGFVPPVLPLFRRLRAGVWCRPGRAGLRTGCGRVARTSARVRSSTLCSRLVSKSNRAGLSSRALHAAPIRPGCAAAGRRWHPSSARPGRDCTADIARQGGLDLQPHEVIGVVEATRPCSSVIASHASPISASALARPDRGGDHVDEVVAQLDRVDVFEDPATAEMPGESVVQPAGRVGRLFPPVADEDPARRGPRPAIAPTF